MLTSHPCIARIHIEGFKRLEEFDLSLHPQFNVIAGNNETGKSSILEAIGMVLTGQYGGRLIQYAIDPYLFNARMVSSYFFALRKNANHPPPRIHIEAYFHSQDNSDLAKLKGTNNSRSEDCPGLAMTIEPDDNFAAALRDYAADKSNPVVLPVEYYRAIWRDFSGNGVVARRLPFRAAIIDTNLARVTRGPNRYVSQLVGDVLSDSQRRGLSVEYKKMQHQFSQQPGVVALNEHLKAKGNPATKKQLSVQMDLSSRASWDSAISAHLDDLPFDCAGKGEQCRVQLRLAIAGSGKANFLLIEEPENHLSHSSLRMLLEDIRAASSDRQVVITTHSAFVLNKLGVDTLSLVSSDGHAAALEGLTQSTKNYFMKLPGYDTLRLILAERCILVEGPSDELVVQRAYKEHHQKLPLEDGVDVISVGSLAFKRFLEIAKRLNLSVRVITDNDGDASALEQKYAEFWGEAAPTISIHFDVDESCPTLEDQVLKANSVEKLNAIFGTEHESETSLLDYMSRNKTDCALALLETELPWTIPGYILNAIK